MIKYFLLISMMFLTSCLPKEEAVLDTGAGESYGGFIGLTEVQTLSSSKIKLSWDSSEDPRVIGYNVYDVTIAQNPKLIKSVNSLASSATIAGLSEGFYYTFRVRAIDKNGKEDVNTNDQVGIPYGGVSGVTVISSSSAKIKFQNVEESEALEINIYCKTNLSDEYQVYANIRNLTKSDFTLTDLTPNLTYTCKANVSVEGYSDNNLETVSFQSLGQAYELIFATQPGNGAAGESLSQQPVIHVMDENGNIVSGGPDSTALITLEMSVNSPTVGSLRGTYSVNAVAGVATFTDINLQEAGAKLIVTKKEDTSGQSFGTGVLQVESSQFNITAGNVDSSLSLITIEPAVPPASALTANGTDTYTVIIALKDSFGNPVSGIKPTFSSNILGDFLIQPFLNTDSSGQTNGSISTTVADDLPPARILSVSSPAGLSSVQALAPFTAGEATKLYFSQQPINSPSGGLGLNDVHVEVQDAQGNRVTSGANSTLTVSMNIASNTGGATLMGTTNISAVGGVAKFLDLGIDITKNGYNLVASSGSLTPAYSNSFNITAGVPQAVSITGPTDVLSGSCSAAITVQLQDSGGNPANAIQNTTIQLGGLSFSQIYSSNTCGGSILGSSITFTPGTNSRTIYLKNSKVEQLTVTGTDTSAVLTQGSLSININPNKINFLAEKSGGGTLTVPAGNCSTKITITPLAEDGSKGRFYSSASLMLTGLTGSQANIYSDSSCSSILNYTNFASQLNALPNSETVIYLKDLKGETLSVNVADVNSILQTTSIPQDIIITASDLTFTGPSTVVAGQCSTAFTVTLKDAQGNDVVSDGNTSLKINGINGVSTTGKMYTSPACGGAGSSTDLIVTDGSSTATLYFKGIASEILDINIYDALGDINASSIVQLIVSPSAFEVTGPVQSTSSECKGPFTVKTLDGLGDPANAVTPITANLGGEGVAGKFFNSSDCSTSIASLSFSSGEGSKDFYFRGQYPASLTLTATDNASVLTTGTLAHTVLADWGWIGTGVDEGGRDQMMPPRSGIKPVSSRYDGFSGAYDIEFSPDYQYMFIADYNNHKIMKFDYQNNQYLGWMGRIRYENGVGASGSNQVTPSTALCVNTANFKTLPGWCVGGRPHWAGDREVPDGGLQGPMDIAVDDNYVYVVNHNQHALTRYEMATGAFDGWIGNIYDEAPDSAATGGPSSCSLGTTINMPTPGWCMGGRARTESWGSGYWAGDGRMYYPRAVLVDSTYLYVGVEGAILRYNKSTGAFTGWIGMVKTTPPTGACSGDAEDTVSSGWCMGGEYKRAVPYNHNGSVDGGIYYARRMLVQSGVLYLIDNASGTNINTYDVASGAFLGKLPNMNHNWKGGIGLTTDGTKLYVADSERVLKVDSTGLIEGWMGKVANPSGMSGNAGCNSLSSNQNTPGWCIGGTGKAGFDSDSFIATRAVTYDGNGSILVSGERFPGIKKFDAVTGVYQGTIALSDESPDQWTANRSTPAEGIGFGDKAMYSPTGILTYGDYIFLVERDGSRIKKLNRYTGELIGWVGGMTSKPTGGDPLCSTANGMGPSPAWCRGANFYPEWTFGDDGMIDDDVDGVMRHPLGITTDGTWLYVTDDYLHRVQRFKISDGSYGGWIGRISSNSGWRPTAGDPGCSGAPVNTYTPGWCKGGMSQSGNGYGYMNAPKGIVYLGGYLYVINRNSYNVSKYNATTGAFVGWIGRVNTSPTSGCSPASNGMYTVSQSGWCVDGDSQAGDYQYSKGGDFNFNDEWTATIATDGTYLYLGNGQNRRIEKYNTNGEWLSAVKAEGDFYTGTWSSDRNEVNTWGAWCSRPMGVWIDGSTMYILNRISCAQANSNNPMQILKMDMTSGNVIGWKGGIDPDFTPTGGEAGCIGATGTTPKWCQGGRAGVGSKLGAFMVDTVGSITGDSEYLYVTDFYANRVYRVPK
ncbi:MAG: Ig-like domain-containing protein [Bdellovibrionales bacterium]|nr:Ig-like domain-containing protein [Bdellovibrionales bacterium]